MNFLLLGYGHWGKKLAPILEKKGKVEILDPKYSTSTSSLEDIFTTKKITHTFIASPEETHYDLCLRSLEKHLHTFVEKPLCLEHQQALILTKLAEKKKKTLFVDYTFLYDPGIDLIMKFLQGDTIGDLQHISSIRCSVNIHKPHVTVTDDLAPHDIYLFQHFSGEMIRSIKNEKTIYDHKQPVETEVHYTLGSVTATGFYSWVQQKKEVLLTLKGQKGMLTLSRNNEGGSVLSIFDGVGKILKEIPITQEKSPLEKAVDDFLTKSKVEEQSETTQRYNTYVQDILFLENLRQKILPTG